MRRIILAGLVALLPCIALARAPMETNQLVDGAGNPVGTADNPLVTTGGSGGGSTGSVTAPGTSGSQAQAVQGINGGVPVGISAGSLPLPAGAATETTQQGVATSNAAISTATGAKTDAATASGADTSIVGALRAIRDRLLGTLNAAITAALPSGSNVIGRVGIDQTTNGGSNAVFVLNLNQTAGGTASGNGIAVQGVANGSQIGVPVGAAEIGSSLPTAAITPTVTQSGTSVVGKASQGNLYSAYAVNGTTTAGYLACINATAAPSAGAAISPVDVAMLAGTIGATAAINYGAGPPNGYSVGITCLVTTSLTTYTAGGASVMQARAR